MATAPRNTAPQASALKAAATNQSPSQDELEKELTGNPGTSNQSSAGSIGSTAVDPNAGKWQVMDTNARQAPRYHDMPDRTVVVFKPGEFSYLAEGHAAFFLRDPSFIVKRPGGDTIPSMPSAEDTDARNQRPTLEPGECIAKYEELSSASLLGRARLRPNGDKFKDAKDRDALVAFLTTAPLREELSMDQRARTPSAESFEGGMDAKDAEAILRQARQDAGEPDPLTGS